MAVILQKPYTSTQKEVFIAEQAHQQGRELKETDIALYALEPWETLKGDTVVEHREEYEEEQRRKEIERQRQEILKQLGSLDLKSIRAIRANDEEYIAQYEAQAQELRKQLQEL